MLNGNSNSKRKIETILANKTMAMAIAIETKERGERGGDGEGRGERKGGQTRLFLFLKKLEVLIKNLFGNFNRIPA